MHGVSNIKYLRKTWFKECQVIFQLPFKANTISVQEGLNFLNKFETLESRKTATWHMQRMPVAANQGKQDRFPTITRMRGVQGITGIQMLRHYYRNQRIVSSFRIHT